MFSKFAKILVTISMLVFAAACNGNKHSLANGGKTPGERLNIASENLEPFTIISKDGNNVIRASDRVFFAYDSSAIDAESVKTLTRQVSYLKAHDKLKVTIEGHCDERGTREYNLALGERRANAVKSYLVKAGVNAKRITTISYGKERPAVIGNNEEAYAENRRAVTVPEGM